MRALSDFVSRRAIVRGYYFGGWPSCALTNHRADPPTESNRYLSTRLCALS